MIYEGTYEQLAEHLVKKCSITQQNLWVLRGGTYLPIVQPSVWEELYNFLRNAGDEYLDTLCDYGDSTPEFKDELEAQLRCYPQYHGKWQVLGAMISMVERFLVREVPAPAQT